MYHYHCCQSGAPFTCRQRQQAGLRLPPGLGEWPNFVCEICSVRALLDRELRASTDRMLLSLERLRLLDTIHAWVNSTHVKYKSKLRQIGSFKNQFKVQILDAGPLTRPPTGSAIGLLWVHEWLSLCDSTRRRREDGVAEKLSYGTIRQLRSAASQFYALDALSRHAGSAGLDPHNRRLVIQACRPTDDLTYTLFNRGLSACIGTQSRPSMALLGRHVSSLVLVLESTYRCTTNLSVRREITSAAVMTLFLWSGWLRSSKVFHLDWGDIDVVEPGAHGQHDLPVNVGVILLCLLPEMKSDRTTRADVVIAYETMGGHTPGWWFHRHRRAHGLDHDWQCYPRPLVAHPDGSRWNTAYYRATYLYPHLYQLQRGGDPYLCSYHGSPGNTLPEKFWSLYCF
ncbi:hypothetical protein ACA910_002304 [Epithemia clementina (nom. ined.)]